MITVTVTQDDIDKGIAHHADACPIALALSRAGHPHVTVDEEYILLIHPDGDGCWSPETLFKTPPTARVFITAFDLGEAVEPFEFTL